jgi:hypothetical protein
MFLAAAGDAASPYAAQMHPIRHVTVTPLFINTGRFLLLLKSSMPLHRFSDNVGA